MGIDAFEESTFFGNIYSQSLKKLTLRGTAHESKIAEQNDTGVSLPLSCAVAVMSEGFEAIYCKTNT